MKIAAWAAGVAGKTRLPIARLLPPDHRFGTTVPDGGSCCANCRFVSEDGERCGNARFVTWRREVEGARTPAALPAPARQYCCDVWEAGR